MLLMDGFDFHLDIAASPSLSIFSASRIVRGCEEKQFVFVLSLKEMNKVNTKVMLKLCWLYSEFQFQFVFVQSLYYQSCH